MTTITISGPGGSIQYEVEIIRRLLESEGFKVSVKDKYPFVPDKAEGFDSWEEYQEHRRKLLSEKQKEIELIADHLPWGG